MKLFQTQGLFNTQLFYLDQEISEDSLSKIITFYQSHRIKRKTCLISNSDSLLQAQKILNFDTLIAYEQFSDQKVSDSDVLILLPFQSTWELVNKLLDGAYPNRLYVDLDTLNHNYSFLKSSISDKVQQIPMIKSNAYGMGLEAIGKHFESLGVPYLGVVYIGEGCQLRQANIKIPIMIMQPQQNFFDRLITEKLEPVFSKTQNIQKFVEILKQKSLKSYPIHIKVETGMNRTGFLQSEIQDLTTWLYKNRNWVKVKTVLSHMSSSDVSSEKDFSYGQLQLFDKIKEIFNINLGYQVAYHMLNSGGVLNYSDYKYQYCRPGIALYGFIEESQSIQEELMPIATLKTTIVQVKHVESGESVSYGRKFIAKQNMKIATLCIGYADFLGRAWGNERGFVFIRGQKATILGTITMDLMMVDVTHIDCQEGDEVEVFGSNVPLQQIAKSCKTIPYEIMTSINPLRVNRFYTKSLIS